MSAAVKVSNINDGPFSFGGIATGDSKYLDFGTLILIVALFTFINCFIYEIILDAYTVGKINEEIKKINVNRQKISGLKSLSSVLIIIGLVIYLYSRLVYSK